VGTTTRKRKFSGVSFHTPAARLGSEWEAGCALRRRLQSAASAGRR